MACGAVARIGWRSLLLLLSDALAPFWSCFTPPHSVNLHCPDSGTLHCAQAINDGVGLVVHSLLLVPYYSWKHSHRRHHSNTGSLAKDEVRGQSSGALGTGATASFPLPADAARNMGCLAHRRDKTLRPTAFGVGDTTETLLTSSV